MNEDSLRLKNWFWFIAVIFLAVGISFSLGIYFDMQKVDEVRKWPIQEGRLLTRFIKTVRGSNDQSVRYEYEVEGKRYEASTVSPNKFTQGESEFFQAKKEDGIKVMVHYNKLFPQEAYLTVSWDPFKGASIYYALSSLFFGIIFGALALTMQLKAGRSVQEKSEGEKVSDIE